jgi:phage terminase large subunit-like protein
MCVFFSGEEPESLRGPEAELMIVDEIAHMRYEQSVFDNMMLGLQVIGPRVLVATAHHANYETAMITVRPAGVSAVEFAGMANQFLEPARRLVATAKNRTSLPTAHRRGKSTYGRLRAN